MAIHNSHLPILNLTCNGCAVKSFLPTHCDNCQNLIGNYSKHQTLIRNYLLLNNLMLSNDDTYISKKSILNKIYKKSIDGEIWNLQLNN